MKYSIFLKAAALILTACCLLAAAACAVGIYAISETGLYNSSYDNLAAGQTMTQARLAAQHLAYAYVARNHSDMPDHMLENYFYNAGIDEVSARFGLAAGKWAYAVYDNLGNLLESSPEYGEMYGWDYETTVITDMLVEVTEVDDWHTRYTEDGITYYLQWQRGLVCKVTVTVQPDGLAYINNVPVRYMQLADRWKYGVVVLLVGAMIVGSLCVVYLCCVAGRSRKREGIYPGGFSGLPLDLYGFVAAEVSYWGAWLFCNWLAPECFKDNYINYAVNTGMVILTAIFCLLVLLVPLGWFYSLVTQIKAGNAYWWHHSVIGWILCKLFAGIRFVIRGVAKIIGLLPMVGRRLLAVVALLLCGFLMILSFSTGKTVLGLLLLLAVVFGGGALLGYDLYGMGTVMAGAKGMAKGDLSTQISSRYLIGSYKEHGENLNAIAGVAEDAAKRQLKSERMKTELITNVSHDIKTPLTSIINYVDLLRQPHTEEEGQQYLEVLERQSHRMKKLLEDLMDMSKASTGNMTVELTRMDAGEAVNQALGEFADKLENKGLQILFTHPEKPVYIRADGRLTWRVLSNLLSNTVKYALPGTRVYIGLEQQGSLVALSIKNISREPLNVTADELTERFVRGDAARNTEGSGLGLNIAKSLMELQKGKLELTVDGDLFKVTLTFPAEGSL